MCGDAALEEVVVLTDATARLQVACPRSVACIHAYTTPRDESVVRSVAKSELVSNRLVYKVLRGIAEMEMPLPLNCFAS